MPPSQETTAAASAVATGAERALVATLAALVAALAFPNTTALIRLLLAVGLATGIAVAWRARHSWRDIPPPFAFAMGAWILWAVLSLAWSIEPAYTLAELQTEFLYAVAALVIASIGIRCAGSERLLLPALTAASCLLAILAIGWYFTHAENPIPERSLGGPGNLSSAVITLFPVAFAAALSPATGAFGRRLGIAMALALLAAGFTTLSRTVGPALALQVILVAVLLRPPEADARRLTWIAAAAFAVALVLGSVVQSVRFGDAPQDAATAAVIGDVRYELWPYTLERIADKPLTGNGYGRGILRKEYRANFGNRRIWHAHNLFLDAGLQLGLPGMALLVTLLGAILATGVRLVRSGEAIARACGAALVAVVAGLVVRNFTDDLWARQNAILFWAVVGILAGLGARQVKK